MINLIWGLMIIAGIGYAALNGTIDMITVAAISSAEAAVKLSFQLIGMMCLWLGIMKVAEKAGLIACVSFVLRPITKLIFPGIPPKHKAMGAIVMTISANMLGLGNAATPLGIKAMQELQTLNKHKATATREMCTFLALCTTGFTLVPATVIALRSATGSSNPSEIVGVTVLVSLSATMFVLAVDFLLRNLSLFWARR